MTTMERIFVTALDSILNAEVIRGSVKVRRANYEGRDCYFEVDLEEGENVWASSIRVGSFIYIGYHDEDNNDNRYYEIINRYWTSETEIRAITENEYYKVMDYVLGEE